MRIDDKLSEIKTYLDELDDFLPSTFNEYSHDLRTKAACERYFEKIVESVVDLAFIIIKERGFKLPEEEKESFDILANENIISKKLATRLKDAKGMRNIIAHQYGGVDDEVVFDAITTEIVADVGELIASIESLLR